MHAPSEVKSSLLDFFYEHVSEHDWLSGVDIYQAGKVESVKNTEGLVTCKVHDMGSKNEVRIKIHPYGHQIQWMECTCSKNRSKGHYCEHMAALMLHIDREAPKLLGNLDLRMPLKPPAGAKKIRSLEGANKEKDDERNANTNAQETILRHLGDSIHSVSLLAGGPQIRVRVEIKPGHISHYDLILDDAAKFITKGNSSALYSPELKKLKVFGETAIVGTKIALVDSEKIQIERIVAISSKIKNVGIYELLRAFTGEGLSQKDQKFTVLKYSEIFRHLGKEFLYLTGHGYFPIDATLVNPGWFEQPLSREVSEDDAAKLIEEEFALERKQGIVFLDPKLALDSIKTSSLTEVIVRKEAKGWFHLDPRYGIGKSSVSMIELLKAYQEKRRDYHRTEDGWIKIPEAIKQYKWNMDETGKFLKVDNLGLLRFRAMMGEFDKFAGSKKMLDRIRDRVAFSPESKAPELTSSQLSLRNYQQNGVDWLWWLYNNGLHGLLADEMGLGKTHQAMALMTCIKNTTENARFMVIAPTTVLDHWADKLTKFCPNLILQKHHGSKRDIQAIESGKKFDVLLTSYGVLLRDINQLSQVNWEVAILDEAHYVKNSDTATYQAACRIQAKMRLCLSGTPIENRVDELKNIFDFLVPGYLGSDSYFRKNFSNPISVGGELESETTLQKMIHPLKLRRTKVNVLDDLPEKIEDVRYSELSEEQVKLYREVVEFNAKPLVGKIMAEGAAIPFLHVFATLNLLKQICDHPALLKSSVDYAGHESGKFELLKQLLSEAFGSDHKVVIYSHYLNMIAMISKYLEDLGIKHVVLTGETRNRGAVINQFQEDVNTKVFLGSLMAGGIGIDLTAASVVIHYDRWWNASKENQATDRVHRIGQTKNIQVIKMVTRGTLEEKIDAMINTKKALFEKFMDRDEELFKSMTRQEVIDLLT